MGFRVADLAFTVVPETLGEKERDPESDHDAAEEVKKCAQMSSKQGGGGNCDAKSAPGQTQTAVGVEALPELRLQLAHALETVELGR